MSRRVTLDLDIRAEGLLKACLGFQEGVVQWNTIMDELRERNLTGEIRGREAEEPMFVIGLVIEDSDFSGLPMPAANLGPVYLARCRFDGCDMRRCSISICPHCSFRGADLRGVDFGTVTDLTGCDFTGALFDDDITIETGIYDEGHPPIGLPERLLAMCRAWPSESREPLTGMAVVPIRVDARLLVPAAFHRV